MKKILKEDLELLDEKLKELDRQLQELGEEFFEAVNQSSETWHDNAPFDAARDRQSILDYEKNKLLDIKRMSRLHEPKRRKAIDIGHTVHIESDHVLKLFIAGDWTAREVVGSARVVSALSPIAQSVIGKKVGDSIMLPKGMYRVVHFE